MKFPVRIEDYNFLVDANHELVCRLDAASKLERETIVAALNLLPVARDLIAEAMDTHIYDDGEEPSEECNYAQFLKDADMVLENQPPDSPTIATKLDQLRWLRSVNDDLFAALTRLESLAAPLWVGPNGELPGLTQGELAIIQARAALAKAKGA